MNKNLLLRIAVFVLIISYVTNPPIEKHKLKVNENIIDVINPNHIISDKSVIFTLDSYVSYVDNMIVRDDYYFFSIGRLDFDNYTQSNLTIGIFGYVFLLEKYDLKSNSIGRMNTINYSIPIIDNNYNNFTGTFWYDSKEGNCIEIKSNDKLIVHSFSDNTQVESNYIIKDDFIIFYIKNNIEVKLSLLRDINNAQLLRESYMSAPEYLQVMNISVARKKFFDNKFKNFRIV